MFSLTIDGQEIGDVERKTILEAALGAGLYIPHLCYHPQLHLPSAMGGRREIYQEMRVHRGQEGEGFDGCNLCLVAIEGREGFFQSCQTLVEDGMSVSSDSPAVKEARESQLATILERHPHACLLCSQATGCDRKICSSHVPEAERCCFLFGNCELQKVAQFIGMKKGLPSYVPLRIPRVDDEPLIVRDYNLCVGCLRCVRVCKDVRGADVLGFVIDEGRVVVGSKKPTLKESGCQFCGYCIEVCPTGALTDHDPGTGEREKFLIPCKNSCPAKIDVPSYVRFMKDGEFEKAVSIIHERVPLAGVLGRVCSHPCEANCRRGNLDEPVAICALKRAAAG
jgi:formate dehydrogenase beta subunit